MPRGGGGGRSGGGGFRGSGGGFFHGRVNKGDNSKYENGHYTYGTPYTGSAGGSGRGYGTHRGAGSTQSPAGLNDDDWARAHSSTSPFGPSSQTCASKFKELRKCIEANDGRTGPCIWYLSQWRACEDKSKPPSSSSSSPSQQPKTKRK